MMGELLFSEEPEIAWLVASYKGGTMINNLPAMQETREEDLIPGREDPLEQEMATCSSILAWKIPWTD